MIPVPLARDAGRAAEPRSALRRQPGVRYAAPVPLLVAALLALGACAAAPVGPSPIPVPPPTCGGLKILIEDALPCARIVEIAVGRLAATQPDQVARGITSVDVTLASCQEGAMPPQVDCAGNLFAQHVLVTFGPAGPGGPVEPSLTVVVSPVGGQVLGIENPLIR
jgi:hypothetical protein